jgi:hypothetical protein
MGLGNGGRRGIYTEDAPAPIPGLLQEMSATAAHVEELPGVR